MKKQKKKTSNWIKEWKKEIREERRVCLKLGISESDYRNYYRDGLRVGFTKEQIDYLVSKIKTYVSCQ